MWHLHLNHGFLLPAEQMDRKAALFFFLFSIGAITAIALFLPRSDDSGALFQRQHVDAALLNSGETGKILKTLNIILPLENKHKDVGLESNVVEVIGRASKDFKKWIQLDQDKKYRDRGIFCYLEMQTKGNNSPIYVYTKRNGEWQKDRTFEVRSDKTVYSFFLDSTETELEMYFEIANTDPMGFHP